jgi:uncharacterized membrane protein YeaQ/YmgE (transglycosylase-associated protein family)
MGLIITIVVGAIVGWLASIVMKTNAQMGSIANILVGVVGAWVGIWLAGLLGIAATNMIVSIVISIVGACILIALLKAVGVLK